MEGFCTSRYALLREMECTSATHRVKSAQRHSCPTLRDDSSAGSITIISMAFACDTSHRASVLYERQFLEQPTAEKVPSGECSRPAPTVGPAAQMAS
ncbi:hypothetical protein BC834DRAFT_872440 [Gloeopeniophorella convolvens]|nr:hypothetical protein BC834DRAFT_872440 [Gloeopeniophorella convolvens]